VRVVARSSDEDGDHVVVEVQNQGAPIPPELKAKIFNPFRRGSRDSRTARTAGLGLGLYISREIVVAHGGELDVRSSTAEGTTFRVRLPRTIGPRPMSPEDKR
jgi:signal transduction histidine kinase